MRSLQKVKKLVAINLMCAMVISSAFTATAAENEALPETQSQEVTDEQTPDANPDTTDTQIPDTSDADSQNLVDEQSLDDAQEQTPVDAEIETQAVSTTPKLQYRVHMQSKGWMDWTDDGSVGGIADSGLRMEAVEMRVVDSNNNPIQGINVEYRCHVQSIGWQDWQSNGATSGTTGRALRVEAIEIKLTGSDSSAYTVSYRANCEIGGWMPYTKNSATAGSTGLAQKMEAFQASIIKTTEDTNSYAQAGYIRGYNDSEIQISGHVQKKGDMSAVSNGEIFGTSGCALRMEAIKIKLAPASSDVVGGGVEYATHIQTYGWIDYVTNGDISGTTGQAKRLEAIRIQLSGEMSKYYDVYYRCHVQKFGWLGWAKNGQTAGSTGYAYRMEAVQVKLVPKTKSAPGENANYCEIKETTTGSNTTTGNNSTTPGNSSTTTGNSQLVAGDAAITKIQSYLGTPYVYGGADPTGWDCSGCVQWIYKNIYNVTLNGRTAEQQSKSGVAVDKSDMSKWEPGDLIFVYTPITHVGIYLGNGKMFHASTPDTGTKISDVEGYYMTKINCVRRVL